ncbi:MAG: metallophosphoesterase [Desulfurococcales archaeon]|nr:metallophosphoesterase [Desulfurococcales archaeon]
MIKIKVEERFDSTYCSDLITDYASKIQFTPWVKFNKTDLSNGFLIVGDIHGSLSNLSKAIEVAEERGIGKIVFLGDYADRGSNGYEVICNLIQIKLNEPDRIIILRGNHESRSMNTYYGFLDELHSKFGSDTGFKLFNMILSHIYQRLTWLVIAGDWLLVHGGVPCKACKSMPGEPATLKELLAAAENTREAIETTEGIPSILMQALWNDPDGGVKWFAPNIRGEGIYVYGRLAWGKFLDVSNLKGIIRSHEVKDTYALWLSDGRYYEGEALEALSKNMEINPSGLDHPVFTVFTSEYHLRGAGAILLWSDILELVRIK